MSVSLFSLEGRVGLVTGSVRGLGLEMARGLGAAGASIYVNGRDGARTAQTARQLAAEGLDVRPLPFDVTDEAAGAQALAEIDRTHGRLDILVNNVGARLRVPLAETTTEGFRNLIETDLTAAFALTKRAADLMKPNGYGRIIMVGSIASRRAAKNNIAYCAAKAGLSALARAFAAEYGGHGITCNALLPGPFATEMNANFAERYPGRTPPGLGLLGRWGKPEEIAGACLFLASPASSFMTGAELVIDGGVSVAP